MASGRGGRWQRSKNKRRRAKAIADQVRIKESVERQVVGPTGRKARFGSWMNAVGFLQTGALPLGGRTSEPDAVGFIRREADRA